VRVDDCASVLQCLFGDARVAPDVAAAVKEALHGALFDDGASTAKAQRFDVENDLEWDQDFEWEWLPNPPKPAALDSRHLGPEFNDAEPSPSPNEARRLPQVFPLSDAAGPATPRVLNRDMSGARLNDFFRVEYFKKPQGAAISHLEPVPTRM
jgi:hypothetical protein